MKYSQYIKKIAICTLLSTNLALATDVIYMNANVITMNEKQKFAEAVAITGNKITNVGSNKDILKIKEKRTKIIDLKGQTLIPGFIDAHGHFYYTALYEGGWINLNSYPIGNIKTVDDLVKRLKIAAKNTPEGEWILGWGYDHTSLKGERHPTAKDLDKVSTKHPIYLQHVTGWFSASNTLALKMANINKNTPNAILDANGKPTGVIASAQSPIFDIVPKPKKNKLLKAMNLGSILYLSNGVTTAQEAWGYFGQWKTLKEAANKGYLKVRVNFMPLAQGNAAKNLSKFPNIKTGTSVDKNSLLSLSSLKLTADGTIKGKASTTKPYSYHPTQPKGYKGELSHKYKDLENMVVNYHKKGYQISIHANGDAAVDDVLKAFKAAQKKYPRKNARHVIIHDQLGRDEQFPKMKELGVTPTFFSSNLYYGGESLYKLYGKKRAERNNPAGSALRAGVMFSLHSDTYVTPIKPLRMMQSAVERKTYTGRDLGSKTQSIPVYEALKAVTINAAWQAYEEKNRGSIEIGKLADLVILNKNPLTVPKSKISDIKIKATILNGKVVWGDALK